MFKKSKTKRDSEIVVQFSETFILPPSVSTVKKLYNRLFGKYTLQKIESQINVLCIYCAVGLENIGTAVELRNAHRLLQRLIYRSRVRDLQMCSIERLVPCAIALVHYTLQHLSLEGNIHSIRNYYYKKLFHKSESLYYNVVWRLTPEMSQRVIGSILTYFTQQQAWHVEHICVNTFYMLLCCHVPLDEVLSSIISAAKAELATNCRISKDMIRVVEELLLRGSPIIRNVGLHEITIDLIKMFHESIKAPLNTNQKYIQDGLEVCIRRALQRLPPFTLLDIIHTMIKEVYNPNLTDIMILDYGSTIEYAITLYQFELYIDTLSKDFFKGIVDTMKSERCVLSILGCRMLERFLDRHENITEFMPKVYYNSMQFDITVGTYHSEDKAFLKSYRQMLHDTVLEVLANHGDNDMVLECLYGILCICVVEIPCGFTAAFIVCIIMNIQELALNKTSTILTQSTCNHFHAVVVSVISLICWIHQSPTFYKYILTVVDRRNEQAPHLLPPLRSHYRYASHHTVYNKPELFFDAWEVRFALWKHFRLNKGLKKQEDDDEEAGF